MTLKTCLSSIPKAIKCLCFLFESKVCMGNILEMSTLGGEDKHLRPQMLHATSLFPPIISHAAQYYLIQNRSIKCYHCFLPDIDNVFQKLSEPRSYLDPKQERASLSKVIYWQFCETPGLTVNSVYHWNADSRKELLRKVILSHKSHHSYFWTKYL